MSLARESKLFIVMGAAQWVLDWAVTVALSSTGMSLEAANVCGRICGAMLGFWLNGVITFAGPKKTLGPRQLGRFMALWGLTTVVSTVAMASVHQHFGLAGAWLAKPVLEGLLAVVSFFVSRHWIYR